MYIPLTRIPLRNTLWISIFLIPKLSFQANADSDTSTWYLNSTATDIPWAELDNSESITFNISPHKTAYNFDIQVTLKVTYSDGMHHAPVYVSNTDDYVFGTSYDYYPTMIEISTSSLDGYLLTRLDVAYNEYRVGPYTYSLSTSDYSASTTPSYGITAASMLSKPVRAENTVFTITNPAGRGPIYLNSVFFEIAKEKDPGIMLPMDEASSITWAPAINLYNPGSFFKNFPDVDLKYMDLSLTPLFETHSFPEEMDKDEIEAIKDLDSYFIDDICRASFSENGDYLYLTTPCSGRYLLSMKYWPPTDHGFHGLKKQQTLSIFPDYTTFKINGKPADHPILNLDGYGDMTCARLELSNMWDTEIFYKLLLLNDYPQEQNLDPLVSEPSLDGFTPYNPAGIDLRGAKSMQIILRKNDSLSGPYTYLYDTTGSITKVNFISGEENLTTEYYDLQGRRLPAAPTVAGFYISRRGNNVRIIKR
ncbi:MAG: hypothetical protein NC328_08080 [Muribaculum sp.]|nr:hypothetical protein [Muribaculum sp.]